MLCPGCAHDNIPGDDLCANCGLDLAGLDVQAWGVDPEDPILSQRVGDLPLKKALILPPGATAAEAIDLMAEEHEGCVFVQEPDGPLLGVLTERDVALRIAARGRDPQSAILEEVMTAKPFEIHTGDRLAFGLHRMGVDGYRHIPVLDGNRILGFLSVRTVLGQLAGA